MVFSPVSMGAPEFTPLMLATLAEEPFSRAGWVFEAKLDGIRCLALRHGKSVRLLSRNELDMTGRFPEIVAALRKQKAESFAVDGELVAFRGDVTSFEALQQRGGNPVFFYLFDILSLGGKDMRPLPLLERKGILARSISFGDRVRFSEHRDEDGESMFAEACAKGWEGIIGKDAAAPYVGKRSKAWLKFKCLESQEFVIGGWTEPAGAREEFGALLVGYHDGGKLKYAGKVGTGFDRASLKTLGAKLARLARETSPFDDDGLPRLRVHWVKPELVAQCAFHEWTAAGKLRQPRFQGLRDDKRAADVVRERKRG